MSYNGRDFREQPPTRRPSHPVVTVTVSVTITLSLVISVWFIFGNRLSVNSGSPTPTPGTIATNPPTITSTQSPVNVSCNKRKETGVGKTATFPFTVATGCVAVVTGVNVTGIPMPWTDGGGG